MRALVAIALFRNTGRASWVYLRRLNPLLRHNFAPEDCLPVHRQRGARARRHRALPKYRARLVDQAHRGVRQLHDRRRARGSGGQGF